MGKITTIILFLAISFSSIAQNEFKPEWGFGFNGGVTLSSLSLSPNVQQEMLMQYVGGITVRYISERNFGLQGELNYSLRGWQEKEDELVTQNRFAKQYAYLELPIMTHIYFDLGKRVRLIFNLGPQISYCLNEKTLIRELKGAAWDEIYPDYYYMDMQIPFDYGIVGGGGFELRTGIGNFILDARYYFGLSNVFKDSKSDLFQRSSNQVINIKLTYLLKQ